MVLNSGASEKEKPSPIAKVVPKSAEPVNHSAKIAQWVKSHPYFKWSTMCLKIGLDKGNFHKWINAEAPVIPEKYMQKIIHILKEYGYAE